MDNCLLWTLKMKVFNYYLDLHLTPCIFPNKYLSCSFVRLPWYMIHWDGNCNNTGIIGLKIFGNNIYVYIYIYIYLFIYCHLYSAFSLVQCSIVLYRLSDGKIQRHTGQSSVEKSIHTLCTSNEQLLQAEASTILDYHTPTHIQ